MDKVKGLILIVACLFFALIIPIPVKADAPPLYHFTVHADTPAKLIIYFVFSQNITNPSVSAIGASQWNMSLSNTQITFSSGEVDVFQFGFTVYYPVGMSQTVEWDVFKGSRQVEDTNSFPVSGSAFSMSFTIITTSEPHYPSAQELINVVLGNYPTMQNFNDWTGVQLNQYGILQQNLTWQYIILGTIAIIFLAGEIIRVWKTGKEGS